MTDKGKRRSLSVPTVSPAPNKMVCWTINTNTAGIRNEAKPICEINSDLPKGLEYIISKCIEPNPEDRYQSGVELLKDLYDYENLPKRKSILGKMFGKKK